MVEPGVNVCDTLAQCDQALQVLLGSEAERIRQGAAARRPIVERYSVASKTVNFPRLFR